MKKILLGNAFFTSFCFVLAAATGLTGWSAGKAQAACGDTLITQSVSQTIESLGDNNTNCHWGSGYHTNNSYFRAFNLSDFGLTDNFTICSVEVGIEVATSPGDTQPVQVRLYTSSQAFPGGYPGSLTLIGETAATVPDSAAGTIISIPVSGTASAGSELVVEIFTPDGQADGNTLYLGQNTAGETGPSYALAADCGFTVPTTFDVMPPQFQNHHIVMNVRGSTCVDADNDTYGQGCAAGPDCDDLDPAIHSLNPDLTAPSGTGVAPRPIFTWQDMGGYTKAGELYYNIQVWGENANNFILHEWYDAAVICDGTICSTKPTRNINPGRSWWWINYWGGRNVCGAAINPGGKYLEITINACTGPTLSAPNLGTTVKYLTTTPFSWQDTGIEWYAVQTYMPAGWIRTNWYQGTTVCSAGICTATPNKFIYLGQHWWWLLTWSVDCGYQLQPSGNFLGFAVTP